MRCVVLWNIFYSSPPTLISGPGARMTSTNMILVVIKCRRAETPVKISKVFDSNDDAGDKSF